MLRTSADAGAGGDAAFPTTADFNEVATKRICFAISATYPFYLS